MAATGYTPISLYYSTTASATPLAANLANGELAININTADGKLYYKDSAGAVQLLASKAGASGSVTSVAQSFTGGLISVSGSPITTSGTLALTVAGTSGGVPYFSSASTWASSAALAANALMIGGGAGAAPSTTTTGTGVITALGVNTGTAGAFVVNGGALGTPASGTVTNLTGTASININGTVGATTPSTGAFTTGSFSGAISVTAAATSTFRNDQNTDTQVYIRNDSAGAAATARFDLFTGTGTDRALTLASFGPGYTGSYAGVNYANLRYISDNAAAANSNGLMLTSASKNVYIAPAATLVGTFSSTGLAVTGTLSATGAVTFTGTNQATTLGTAGTSTQASALYLEGGTGTGGGGVVQFQKNGTLAGAVGMTSRLLGGTTSNMAYYAAAGLGHNWYANGNVTVASPNMSLTSTGLAVTGTLYSSDNFYSGGVANGQTPDATHAGQAITISNQMYNSAGATSADSVLIRFINTNGLVGTINVSGSATAYNTSSDQRLKEDLGISTDVSVLQNLKIHDFKWKVDGSQDRGVFAQEAYQVKPSAIRVGSDDIDEYGHLEKPWSADYSKFVPDLIVGWKNHEDRIARLEAALANAGISLQ